MIMHQTFVLLAITLGAYQVGIRIERRYPMVPAILWTVVLLAAILPLAGVSDSLFAHKISLLTVVLGPATVALAVPVYRHREILKRAKKPILSGIVGGSIVGMMVSGGLAFLWPAPHWLVNTVIPKAATTPIAMGVLHQLGGNVSLGTALTVMAGHFGAITGPPLLRLLGIKSPVAEGMAVGTSASGIGTARMIRESDIKGSISAVAMALSGIAIAVLAPWVSQLWR